MRDGFASKVVEHPVWTLPLRLLVVGKSQLSGKTSFVANLLLRKRWYKGQWKGEDIYIVCPSTKLDSKWATMQTELDIPPENVLHSYDEDALETLYNTIQAKHEKGGKEQRHRLIIFDDLSYSGALKNKVHGAMARLFCNGRHLLLSSIVTAQKYSDLLTTCRENVTGAVFFGCSTKQLELLEMDHNYGDRKEFRKVFRECTAEPHSFMAIDYSHGTPRLLDSDFDEIAMEPLS